MPLDVPARAEISFSSVALNVADLARAEKFYSKVFGSERTFQFPQEGDPVEIGLGSSGQAGKMGFLPAHFNDDSLPDSRTAYGRIVVNVTDAEGIAKLATDRGSTISRDLKTPWGARLIFFDDPEGYEIELYQAAAGLWPRRTDTNGEHGKGR